MYRVYLEDGGIYAMCDTADEAKALLRVQRHCIEDFTDNESRWVAAFREQAR